MFATTDRNSGFAVSNFARASEVAVARESGANALSKLAQAEGVLGIVILADEKSQAIEVISLARNQQQRDALERALKLLTPKKTNQLGRPTRGLTR